MIEAMNNCDYTGIAFALRNISWVTELGNYYFWKDIPHSTGSVKDIVSMSELMLNQLIKASLKNLKQLNCFIDISHCLIQYFCFVPTLWPEYLKQLHSHVLGMIDASKEYLVLNIDSLYWLRKSNKCLFQLFKSIFARIKMDRKLTDVMNSFCTIVADVAFNLCIFDWLEREHIEIYTSVKNTIEDTEITSPSCISSYMNVIKAIMTNQELISGLSGVDSFLLYFGIGDDVLRPQVVENLKKLFQTISITIVYFVDLKLIDSSKKLLEKPELNQFKFAVVEIYRFFLQIWRCFCDLWNLQVVCQRSPQLVKAIQRSNRRMIECSYEQRFTGFENMELRLQAFGKNLIRCLSSIFLFSMKNYSDCTIYVTNSFYSDIITARSTFIRTEFHTMETSSCLEEGNWLVEASNITDDVNMAVTYFCLRVIDLSSLINVEILKNITDKTPLDPATLSKFESLIYTDHSTWISLIKLLFTLIAYGSSKTIIRICDHSYIQNHLKLRLAHFQDNSQFYDGLITHMLNCLYIRSIYKPLDHTFQEITSFPSQVVLTEKLNIICSETLPLKNKRQALYSILNKITTDEENVEMLVDQIEKLSVAETNVNKRPSMDTEDKPLNDLDLIEIRFLFE
ncbi:hypothetical protein MXB_4292 [Myxobolus squamalis]|nr:hypothetical protein MXB_4292 [Myxobolus squamalis]